MRYYPVALDLANRSVLVVGGGAVGERKVEGALAAGARVTVVAARLTERLRARAAEARIGHLERDYRRGDVDGHDLVFVAVDREPVRHAVVEDARAARVWVNVADDPARCDFILPSVLRRGDLVVAVSTGGASPALARSVRERLEETIGAEYETLTTVVAEVRAELRVAREEVDAAAWSRALADDDLRRLARAGRHDDARRRLRAQLTAR